MLLVFKKGEEDEPEKRAGSKGFRDDILYR